jgi:hypothetical protein
MGSYTGFDGRQPFRVAEVVLGHGLRVAEDAMELRVGGDVEGFSDFILGDS